MKYIKLNYCGAQGRYVDSRKNIYMVALSPPQCDLGSGRSKGKKEKTKPLPQPEVNRPYACEEGAGCDQKNILKTQNFVRQN